jgi:hypothetical protein
MEPDPSLRFFEITGTAGFFCVGMFFSNKWNRRVFDSEGWVPEDGDPEVLSFGVAGYPSSRNRGLFKPSNTRRPTSLESTSLQWSLHESERASERASARVICCCCCCSRWMTRRRRRYSLLHADMSHLQQLPHAPPPRRSVQKNACCCLQSVGDPYRPMCRWKNSCCNNGSISSVQHIEDFLVLVSCPRGARTSISRKLTKRRRRIRRKLTAAQRTREMFANH